jgi:hypothetical protein
VWRADVQNFEVSKFDVTVLSVQYYLHEDCVLNSIFCFSFRITTITWRGTDRSMKK